MYKLSPKPKLKAKLLLGMCQQRGVNSNIKTGLYSESKITKQKIERIAWGKEKKVKHNSRQREKDRKSQRMACIGKQNNKVRARLL